MAWISSEHGNRLWVDVQEPAEQRFPRRTVLYTHGFAQDSRGLHHQVDALLQAGHRVLTWHLPGHGHSPAVEREQCTLVRLAGHLVEVAAACAPDDGLVLVGHSMGGMTLMQLGLDRPEWVREHAAALALLSTQDTSRGLASFMLGAPVGRAVTTAVRPLFHLLAHRWGWPAVRATGPLLDALVWAACSGPGTTRTDIRLTVEMAGAAGFATMGDWLPALLTVDVREGLAAYRGLPALVLGGSRDALVPPADCAALAEHLPGSRLVSIPGAGHNVMLAAPRRVSRELVELAGEGAGTECGK